MTAANGGMQELKVIHSSGVNVMYRPRSYSLPPDDLFFLDFLACARVVRPKRDPSRRAYSFRLIFDVIGGRIRPGSFGDISFYDLVLELATSLSRRPSPNLV